MNALLIEEHPLLRLGLLQMLENIQDSGHVAALAPDELGRHDNVPHNADLLVFGMPADTRIGWAQLQVARELLSPQRILVLADQLPLHMPDADSARGVCGCLPKSASLAVIEAAIRLAVSAVQGLLFSAETGTMPSASRPALPVTQSLASAAPLPAAAQPEQLSLATCASAPRSAVRSSVAVRDLTGLKPGLPLSGSARATEPTAEAEPSYDEAEMLKITPRQYEVLVLLARGYPIKTVSRMLNISVATVKSHACTLYQRLKVRNKGEAVYAALQRGATLEWVSGDERVTRDSSMRPVVARHSEAAVYEAASPTI
ncbi:hypothetical protein LMG23992_03465 [Cupriavidus laharis]|uniref:HTH luxR-type domain-containing protein n=1 Tax=Cupriavidus laharis TaxID=151654 RepID=A0ABM8XB89_9BURK|nr:LuxR C-terminal-related transcriptional regulator [Cupriavidus laharis]CAG9177300.1 hypothetical protein LMG23992_03465 [Cupriavidus laharis]